MTLSNFQYEFNSLIEMNAYGGNVVITNSEFDNINTCGSLIRNKAAILDQSSLFTPSTVSQDFYTYYLMRSSLFLTDQMANKYATMTSPFASSCSETSPCLSIVIDST